MKEERDERKMIKGGERNWDQREMRERDKKEMERVGAAPKKEKEKQVQKERDVNIESA
ncbi:hypothetical protein BgiBS90_017377, partial [Biomphalaria glabrata]